MYINHHKIRLIASTIAAISMSGCLSTSQVLEMGRDSYSVTATADGYCLALQARESAFQAGTKNAHLLASASCSSMSPPLEHVWESTPR